MSSKNIGCTALTLAPELTIFHTGPSFDKGPLPAVFYFALSAEDSLTTDPYNQFVHFIYNPSIRIFSLTLPGHENNLPPNATMRLWAEDIQKGIDPFASFFEKVGLALRYLLLQNIILPEKLGLAGLSRGGFAAAHIASQNPEFRYLALFAPLTDLRIANEFQQLKEHPLVLKYDLQTIAHSLFDRHIRIYIGNRDVRVSTKSAFHWVESLVERAYEKKIRSPQVELLLTPSIGSMGHGTSAEIFKEGALWISDHLLQRF